MIISRTPLRVSLLGGGTDYPEHSSKHGGLVIGAAIDRFAYITVRHLPPFHAFRHRVVYKETEEVGSVDDIGHRAVRACLKYLQWHDNTMSGGLEIGHLGDLPGRSGTGSSSSFVVGLLKALSALRGRMMLPDELARAAIDIERNWLGEAVGCQDQTFAAYGGLNVVHFHRDGGVDVQPVVIDAGHERELGDHLLLFFTGIERTSSAIAATYVPTLAQKERELFALMRLTQLGVDAVYARKWERLGDLIDQSWRLKAGLSTAVAPLEVNKMYALARLNGAWGGKLTGAGGGGCFLLVAPPDKHQKVIGAMTEAGCVHVPFRFAHQGSTIIFSERTAHAA